MNANNGKETFHRILNSLERQGEGAFKSYPLPFVEQLNINKDLRVVVIIPAHNEERVIGTTIRSLFNQTRLPDCVLIVADNCTDETVTVVRRLQAEYSCLEVMETINNKAKKAGALNQGLVSLDPTVDYVLIMDADTGLDPGLLEGALNQLEENPALGAVCSRAGVAPPPSKTSLWERIIWQIQHLEYGHFDSQRIETLGRIKVVHGMAAVYRLESLRQVAAYRKQRWGIKDQFYAEDNLVEDYELTLCLKELCWGVTVAMGMLAWTNVPLSVRALWRQRLRWLRGGVDSLRRHGWDKATKWDILDHGVFIVLFCLQILILVLIAVALSHGTPWAWSPWLVLVFLLCYIDGLYRLKYVQNLRPGDILTRVALIPELLYGWFQMVAMVYAYYLSLAEVDQDW